MSERILWRNFKIPLRGISKVIQRNSSWRNFRINSQGNLWSYYWWYPYCPEIWRNTWNLPTRISREILNSIPKRIASNISACTNSEYSKTKNLNHSARVLLQKVQHNQKTLLVAYNASAVQFRLLDGARPQRLNFPEKMGRISKKKTKKPVDYTTS